MIVRTTPRLASLGPRLRNVVLTIFALFVAHDAIYAAQFGVGARFAQAMTAGGHDGYWATVSLAIGGVVALILLGVIGVWRRLERGAAGAAHAVIPGPSYLNELASTWLRLFPTVALLFGIQENLEHYLLDGHFIGLWALFGPGSSIVLPVLAATTLVLAALGSLVRWRIRLLEARIATGRRQTHPRPLATRQPPEWFAIAAAIAQHWILSRRDAGRAPPPILARSAHATA